jgi:hypothetical protein
MKEYYKVQWMTQEFLRETFTYCESGNLIWKHDRPVEHFATLRGWRVYLTQRAGIIAGKIAINERVSSKRRKPERDTPVVMITYKGYKKNFPLHNLIFMYHHGYVPNLIDHMDNNYLNNKIENLRELNTQLNTSRAGMFGHNTTGYRGVRFRPRDNKYIVNIKVDGYGYYCGQYEDIEFAASVYNYISQLIFGEYSFKNDVPILTASQVDQLSSQTFFATHLPNILKEMDSKYGTERKFRP